MVLNPSMKLSIIMKSINKIYHIDKLNMKNNIILPTGYQKGYNKIQEPLTSMSF